MRTMTHSACMLLVLAVLVGASLGCCNHAYHADGGVLDIGDLARDFWSVRTTGNPKRFVKPRIAVVEFTVQYVAETGDASDFGSSMKLELPGLVYRSFDREMADTQRYLVPLEELAGSFE